MNAQRKNTAAPHSAKGEVSGAFLIGLVNSFHNISVLPRGVLDAGLDLQPQAWYPYAMLMDMLETIERQLPALRKTFIVGNFAQGVKVNTHIF